MSKPTAKYSQTKWKEYKVEDMSIGQQINQDKSWSAIFSDCAVFTYNTAVEGHSDASKSKIFLIDEDDMAWIKGKIQSGISKTDSEYFKLLKCLLSLENFLEGCPNKRICIRTITDKTGEDLPRVMVDEVLEIIPLLLKQQKTPLNTSDNRIEVYIKKLMCDGKDMYNTIDMKEFEKMLEEFDVNKSLLTVIPDIHYQLTTDKNFESNKEYVYTLGPYENDICYPSQAAFLIFQHLVVNSRWNKDYCREHRGCKNDFRSKILDVLKKYSDMNQNVLVKYTIFNEELQSLMTHCTYKHQIKHRVDTNILNNTDCWEMISLIQFQKLFTNTDVPFLLEMSKDKYGRLDNDAPRFPVFQARAYFAFTMIQFFVPLDMQKLKSALLDALIYKVPEPRRMEIKTVLAMKSCELTFKGIKSTCTSGPTSFKTTSTGKAQDSGLKKMIMLNLRAEDKEKLLKLNKLAVASSRANDKKTLQFFSKSELSNGSETKSAKVENAKMANIEEKNESVPLNDNKAAEFKQSNSEITEKMNELTIGKNNKSKNTATKMEDRKSKLKEDNSSKEKSKDSEKDSNASLSSSNQSKCCSKCLRTSQMCNEANKKLKTFEDKAKKFDEMDKKMKEKNKEIEMLKKKSSESDKELKTIKEKAKKNDELEKQMTEKDDAIETLKKQVQEMEKFEKMHKEAEERMHQMNIERDNLTKKVAQFEAQKYSNSQMSQLENELQEKDRVIAQLREENMRVTVRNEEQARNIQNLLDRLTAPIPK